MTEVTKHAPGTFCWTELASPNAAASKKFYQSLFGWTLREFPIGDGETYTMLLAEGLEVCALYENEEVKAGKVPAHWLAYISVENADETAKKAQAAGGKLLHPAMDVMDVGRMAVIQDPTGAFFAAWQPRKSIGARVQEVAGSVCWRELITPNEDVAAKFYSTVFGWVPKVEKLGPVPYTLFQNGDTSVGGMLKTPMPGIPPHWGTYWIVDDIHASVKKVQSLGGKILKEETPIPGIGTFAVAADPHGAPFSMMQGEA
jgi:predicted enzyme related to lactoylglutathione lyase